MAEPLVTDEEIEQLRQWLIPRTPPEPFDIAERLVAEIKRLRFEIRDREAGNDAWRRLAEGLEKGGDWARARAERYRTALEKIADPRKRDHREPDAYTELGCVMNIAAEALKEPQP